MSKLKIGQPEPNIDYGPLHATVVFCGRTVNLVGSRDSCGAWYRDTADDRRLEIRTLDALGSIKHEPSETSATTVIFSEESGTTYWGQTVNGINLQAAADGLERKLRSHMKAIEQALAAQPAAEDGK